MSAGHNAAIVVIRCYLQFFIYELFLCGGLGGGVGFEFGEGVFFTLLGGGGVGFCGLLFPIIFNLKLLLLLLLSKILNQ